MIMLLGLWGALIPFVGPYFDYSMHTDQTWQWFADRGWLEVLPGAVAVLGGLILMGGITRISMRFGALLALAAGLWFVAGPTVSMLWHHGSITVGPPIGRHTITKTLEWIGYFYGTGGLITMFSSYALGYLTALPIVDERVVGRTVAAGTGAAAGYAAGRATAPRRTAAPATAPGEGAAAADDETRVAPAADRDTAAAPRTRGGRFFRRRRATTRT